MLKELLKKVGLNLNFQKKEQVKTIAVVGSGPAGLAAAQQLNRAGHTVTVFERDDEVGGLLRYGIPNFKLEKGIIDRRIDILEAEGITFKTNVNVGVNYDVKDLKALMLLFYVVVQLKEEVYQLPGSRCRRCSSSNGFFNTTN